jgi:outer membrane lipoprotein-sorting protein
MKALGLALAVMLFVGQAARPVTLLSEVRGAIAEHDLTRAEGLLAKRRAEQGTTPEVIEAISWLGRGALAERQLDRAEAAWSKVKTVRATFEQTITNSLTGRVLTATGEYQQERPGKLGVRFADPANDRIVADGKYVWLYLPSSAPEQVIKTVQSTNGTGTVDLTAQFLTAPRSRYKIDAVGTQVVSGRATHGFNLIPKNTQGAPFVAASSPKRSITRTIIAPAIARNMKRTRSRARSAGTSAVIITICSRIAPIGTGVSRAATINPACMPACSISEIMSSITGRLARPMEASLA